jgi:hypothetical protein
VALVAICDAIFHDDDYTGGLAVLRTDTDATWRSDTLAMLSDEDNSQYTDANGNTVSRSGNSGSLNWISNVGNAAVPSSITQSPGRSPSMPLQIQSFGTPVDFQSVFAGRIGKADDATTKPAAPSDQR